MPPANHFGRMQRDAAHAGSQVKFAREACRSDCAAHVFDRRVGPSSLVSGSIGNRAGRLSFSNTGHFMCSRVRLHDATTSLNVPAHQQGAASAGRSSERAIGRRASLATSARRGVRWVDLINRLNESEQRAAEARARVQFADQSSRACVEQSRRSLADLQQSIKDAEHQIQRTRELFAQARRDKKSN